MTLPAVLLVAASVVGEAVSPNGRVACCVTLDEGRPVASVSYGGRPAFVSELGFRRAPLEVTEVRSREVRSSWKPVWGFRSEYPENYAEMEIVLAQAEDHRYDETICVRCYDEGFAVRTQVQLEVYGLDEIREERTSWRFPDGTAAWAIPGTESTFPRDPIPLAALDAEKRWRMPLTMTVPGVGFASVHEANVRDYPRSYLQARAGVLSPVFAVGTKEGRGLTASPWRAVQLAESPAGLIETAYFIENLNDPCAIADTSWIRPGLSVSDHGNCELRTDEVIAAARAAKRFGAAYFQVDWGWYGTEYPWSESDCAYYAAKHPELAEETTWRENARADPHTVAKGRVPYHPYWPYDGRSGVDFDIPKVVAALREMGMGLGLYVHGVVLEANDLDDLFSLYESWGVAALKPGFVSYGSQRSTEYLRRLAEVAARHHLWLDVHDSQIPDGFERTWPNVMITEGGGGEEGRHPVRQNVALPFTRCLCGPFDFTPSLFSAHDGAFVCSKAHKVAMFLAYPGPTAVMRGNVIRLMEEDASIMEFLKALPWNYDETKVLDAGIARHLAVARRRGDDWFLAGLAGEEAHETALDFAFLPEGRDFELTLWRDDPASAAPRGYIRETRRVRRGDRMTVAMSAAGGFCATLKGRGAN